MAFHRRVVLAGSIATIAAVLAPRQAGAQSAGTIEGALIGRHSVLSKEIGAENATTVGAQFTFYLARPLALEAEGSTGTTTIRVGASRLSSGFRPVALRGIWMPSPWMWDDVRLLVGGGYTWYDFTDPRAVAERAAAFTFTSGLQWDLSRLRLRFDVDVLGVNADRSRGRVGTWGGAVRFAVGTRAPRFCCP